MHLSSRSPLSTSSPFPLLLGGGGGGGRRKDGRKCHSCQYRIGHVVKKRSNPDIGNFFTKDRHRQHTDHISGKCHHENSQDDISVTHTSASFFSKSVSVGSSVCSAIGNRHAAIPLTTIVMMIIDQPPERFFSPGR